MREQWNETERDRESEKPYKTIFLPGECNKVMKKEGGPWAHGPLIKLSEQGVREAGENGGREGVKDGE